MPLFAGSMNRNQLRHTFSSLLFSTQFPFRINSYSGIFIGSTKPFEFSEMYHMDKFVEVGKSTDYRVKLCVIKLDRSVKGSADIFPAGLPDEFKDIRSNPEQIFAFGWATTNSKYSNAGAQDLFAFQIPLLNRENCDRKYGKEKINDKEVFCMGDENSAKLILKSDLGAPVISNLDGVVHGISIDFYSFPGKGQPEGNTNMLYYVVDVKKFTPEILYAMRELMSDVVGQGNK